ncbi:LADA_0D05930g1_1 [Lachancea dasiensis]|uniref:LADA_0D05930g1_1 n=1 Tax=Lachancea dasiensis TaxID=1072105 RepID=A0A1G4J621_9SACH|nr:LADA_0D05930g1_1 [Lachancea dasiensis]
MGYVTSGYATRPHKRARKVVRKVYYEHGKSSVDVNNDNTRIAGDGRPLRAKIRRLQLEDLDQDVLERIFLFSGRNSALAMVNQRFYHLLRPTPYLIHSYLRQNYICDINAAIMRECERSYQSRYVLAEAALDNSMFLQFLDENPHILDVVDEVAPLEDPEQVQESRSQAFIDNTLQDLSSPCCEVEVHLVSGKPLKDFPASIYRRPAIFFHNDIESGPVIYNQLLLRLHAFYAIQHSSWATEMVMQWFFEESPDRFHPLNINHLFCAINLILHISVENNRGFMDVHPLVQLIDHMYISLTSHLSQLLLCERLEDPVLISDRKGKIIVKFINKFYRNNLRALSEDALWRTLHRTKNPKLLETITKLGGKPSFNIMK